MTTTPAAGAPRSIGDDEVIVELRHEDNYHGGHARRSSPRRIVSIKGGGEFVVVMTVRKGDPPAVTSSRHGGTVRLNVGRQTVTFDGKKIVVGAPSRRDRKR